MKYGSKLFKNQGKLLQTIEGCTGTQVKGFNTLKKVLVGLNAMNIRQSGDLFGNKLLVILEG